MAVDAERTENLMAGLEQRLPPPSVPATYWLALIVVCAAMVVLPAVYVSIVVAAASAVLWWAVHGLDLLTHGSLGSLKIRVFLYLAPLVAGSSLPVFLVKPLFSREARSSTVSALDSHGQPVLFAFLKRLASAVGAPVPERVTFDCEVNAGAEGPLDPEIPPSPPWRASTSSARARSRSATPRRCSRRAARRRSCATTRFAAWSR